MLLNSPYFLGIFEGHFDPAVAIVQNGKVLAYAEEERFVRKKHAYQIYPRNALKYCLDYAGITPKEIAAIGIHWDLKAYSDGSMQAFFAAMNDRYTVDANTRNWQQSVLSYHNADNAHTRHQFQWRRAFGDVELPPLCPLPHHYVHALHAFSQSPFDCALTFTLDGSGDNHCTCAWLCDASQIRPIRRIYIPNSLGWFYAAFTEYLGFNAYDGEYKVMGMAAYGKPNLRLEERVRQVLYPASDNIEYRLDLKYIHYGKHDWSGRFTNELVTLFERPPRLADEPLEQWHFDLAYAVQKSLEEAVIRLVRWAIRETGVRKICIGGGVGHNIKMNSALFALPEVEDVFAQPLCSDAGAAAGAALGACWETTGAHPERLTTLALGYEEEDDAIHAILERCGISYQILDDVPMRTAENLANGKVVGWFQGRMEGGPRALGQRSILADPRDKKMRDRVNVIKRREEWRPLCPSIPEECASRFFDKYTFAPFMNIAFAASDELLRVAPAIVHVDRTARVQFVNESQLSLFHSLLAAFEKITSVPVLLNTSFNIKGEPIVCTFRDALRTFFATEMDILVAGKYLVSKTELCSL